MIRLELRIAHVRFRQAELRQASRTLAGMASRTLRMPRERLSSAGEGLGPPGRKMPTAGGKVACRRDISSSYYSIQLGFRKPLILRRLRFLSFFLRKLLILRCTANEPQIIQQRIAFDARISAKPGFVRACLTIIVAGLTRPHLSPGPRIPGFRAGARKVVPCCRASTGRARSGPHPAAGNAGGRGSCWRRRFRRD